MSSRRQQQQHHHHSRRSACERCRRYKLRCERDPRQQGVCERCRKSDATCVAGFNASTSLPPVRGARVHEPVARGAHPSSAVVSTPRATLHPNTARHEQESAAPPGPLPPAQPTSSTHPPCSQHNAVSQWAEPLRHVDAAGGGGGACDDALAAGCRSVAPDSLASVGPSPCPGATPPLLPGPALGVACQRTVHTNTEQLSLISTTPSLGNLMSPGLEYGSEATAPLSPHETNLLQDGFSSRLSDLVVDPFFFEGQDSPPVDAPNHLQDLFTLSQQLLEDARLLGSVDMHHSVRPPSSPNSTKVAIQRLLEKSSWLSEIIKSLANENTHTACQQPEPSRTRPHLHAASGDSSAPLLASLSAANTAPEGTAQAARPSPHHEDRIMQATTLVTAYILLARNWRAVLLRLHGLVLSAAASQSGLCALGATMPSIQLGGFQLRDKPRLQIAMLLELGAEMVLQIEAGLGIRQWSFCGGYARDSTTSGRECAGQQRPAEALITDPVPVSIRDMILSQEELRLNACEGLDGLPLSDIKESIEVQLGLESRSSSFVP